MPLPAQLSAEEKSLKKKYSLLREKRRALKLREKESQLTPSQPKKEIINPKDAKEAAKKLVASGGIVIKMSVQRNHGFKRSRSLQDPEESSSNKKSAVTVSPTVSDDDYTPVKPVDKPQNKESPGVTAVKAAKSRLTKDYYSRFVRPSDQTSLPAGKIPKINPSAITDEDCDNSFSKQECTLCVSGEGVTEEIVMNAFGRFGPIQLVTVDTVKGSAFVTYESPMVASKAKQEMHGSNVSGKTRISVEPASKLNGYVEVTPEMEQNSWAMIAAGRNVTKGNSRRTKQSLVKYDVDL